MALRWTLHGDGIRPDDDNIGRLLHVREGSDGAAAALTLSEGRHVISITIDACERNSGFMYIGLLAADDRLSGWPLATRQRHWRDIFSGPAPTVGWAFCPLNGHLHTTDNPDGWGPRGRKLMPGDLSGKAAGAVVALHVDMDLRTLGVAVNGSEPVDAQVRLPSKVRPWVVLAHSGDRVTLTGYRGPALVRSAVAAEEWLRLALRPCVNEHTRTADLSRDVQAVEAAADLTTLAREGLVTEAIVGLLNTEYDVAPTANALLARLLHLEVLAPLNRRSKHWLRPPALSSSAADEPTFVALCLLPEKGHAAPAQMLTDPSAKPNVCALNFLRVDKGGRVEGESDAAAAATAASAAATAASAAAAANSAAGFSDFDGSISASAVASAAASAAPAPPSAAAVIPSCLWSVLICRCLMASELIATADSRPPHLSERWALLAFGTATVELRRMGVHQIRLSIWDPHPTPVAMCIASLAAQAVRAVRKGAARSDGLGSLAIAPMVPALTIWPKAVGGRAAFDLLTVRTRLQSHLRIIDARTGTPIVRTAFFPWVGAHDDEHSPDIFLLCRTPSADEPLTALLHLMLSRMHRKGEGQGSRRMLTAHLHHAALTRAGAEPEASSASQDGSMIATEIGGSAASQHDMPTGGASRGSKGGGGGGGDQRATVLQTAVMLAAEASRELEAVRPHLLTLGESLLCVPVVSHAAIEPLRYLDPAHGRDWCDPLLLQWSLALELYHAGRLFGLAPLLLGSPRDDGLVDRFEWIGRAQADGGPSLPDQVSHETLTALQAIAKQLHLKLSPDARYRTVRGTIESVVRAAEALQWSDLLDSLLYTPPPLIEYGGAAGATVGSESERRAAALSQEASFQHVCGHHLLGQGALSLGARIAALAEDAGQAGPITDPYALHQQRLQRRAAQGRDALPSGGGASLDVTSQLAAAAARLEQIVHATARRAVRSHGGVDAAGRPSPVKPGGGGGQLGMSVEELLRRLGDPSGVEKLLSVARLSPAEHTRALELAKSWCGERGVEAADDLLGGGVDLEADAALWEEFLAALRLSSPVLANRIRRELMRRRAALVTRATSGADADAPPLAKKRLTAGGTASVGATMASAMHTLPSRRCCVQ